jgi:3D (Asp-Asp-Asp) domain-containing protein
MTDAALNPARSAIMKLTTGLTWRFLVVVTLFEGGCAGRVHPTKPAPTQPLAHQSSFTATAYCTGTVTATGTSPGTNTVAADPAVLPMGSRIRLTGVDKRYNRVYVVADTGANIRGRRIDLYMRDCREAIRFGRRSVTIAIVQ